MKNILLISLNAELEAKMAVILQPQGISLTRIDSPEKAKIFLIENHSRFNLAMFDAELAKGAGLDILLELKDIYPALPFITATALEPETKS